MCAISDHELMIVGGRNDGECMRDYFILETFPHTGEIKSVTKRDLHIWGEDVEVWPL